MRLPIDHFKFIARWYDVLLKRPENDPLPRLVAAGPGDLVLDVGGGTGRNAHSPLATGARVVVCDVSRRMLREANQRGLAAIHGSATALPLADASADRILIVDAFHHFVDPSPAVAQALAIFELLRVLKPGGRLIVEEPDIGRMPVKFIALGEKLLLMGSRFVPPDQIQRLFEAGGAVTVERHDGNATAWLVFSR